MVTDRDVERLARLERLMTDPEIRQRLGANAVGGPSAILAAGAWVKHGDDPQSENGAPPAARGVRPLVAGVVGRETGGQVHHREAQPAQVALVDGAASSLNGAHDDRGRLSGDRVAGGVGDEE